ncbi:MAG: 30S ribosomal protein S16 [bacterium]|nr:30S ribosomal protein S16 [bacterium]
MAVKIRLQRFGKKDAAFFHLVVADGRAPRDGKFIEKLGTYNPNSNPATIELNFDSTLDWLMKGAQPTDTCRAILSYKGVMMKKHLVEGMKKGALTEAQVEQKFSKWLEEKSGKILGKHDRLSTDATEKASKRHKAESAAKEAKAEKLAAKLAEKEAHAHAAREAALASAEAKAAETPASDEAAG